MKYRAHIAKLKTRLLKTKVSVRDTQLIHPQREWALGLGVSALIFSLCGFWSVHTYLKNRIIVNPTLEDGTQEVVYKESTINEALEIIAARKQIHDELTDQPIVIEQAVEEIASSTPTIAPLELINEASTTETVPTLVN
jgi:uncharacterized protein YneF (UPF0154 family)